jgi:hypothetical protein
LAHPVWSSAGEVDERISCCFSSLFSLALIFRFTRSLVVVLEISFRLLRGFLSLRGISPGTLVTSWLAYFGFGNSLLFGSDFGGAAAKYFG